MKKIFAVILTLILIFSFAGCDNVLENKTNNTIKTENSSITNSNNSKAESSNNSKTEGGKINDESKKKICTHVWQQWQIVKEPNCTQDGEKLRTCSNCSKKEQTTIKKLNHIESEWIIDRISTPQYEGKKHTECIYCKKEIKNQSIAKIDKTHKHQGVEWITTKYPDCTNDGSKDYICSCGFTIKSETITALEHSIVVDKAVDATCTSNGLTEGSHCSVCHKILVKQTEIKAQGHSMSSKKVVDTSSELGYILHFCTKCSYSYKEALPKETNEIFDKNGISYIADENGNLWVCGIGNCTSSDIVIPSNVNGKTVIGVKEYSFMSNSGIKSVTFGKGITVIKSMAFAHCAYLKVVNFPSSLKRIEDHAFYNCKLETLTLPDGLEYIGVRAAIVESGKLIIPDSVKEIGNYAFTKSGIEEVVIPGNVTLGTNVFKDCSSLKKVFIKDGLKSIPKQTFANCKQLEEINLPASITSYGSRAFSGCYKLRIQHLSIKNVNGYKIFSGMIIDTLEIYSNITSDMFSECSIGTLILHEGITTIGEDAFWGAKISNIQFPASLTTVDSYAFYNSALNDVVFKSAVTLGHSAFMGSTIKTLTLPKGSKVGLYVFVNCENLQSVTFGGTKNEWNDMISYPNYGFSDSDFKEMRAATIICSDGTISPKN